MRSFSIHIDAVRQSEYFAPMTTPGVTFILALQWFIGNGPLLKFKDVEEYCHNAGGRLPTAAEALYIYSDSIDSSVGRSTLGLTVPLGVIQQSGSFYTSEKMGACVRILEVTPPTDAQPETALLVQQCFRRPKLLPVCVSEPPFGDTP